MSFFDIRVKLRVRDIVNFYSVVTFVFAVSQSGRIVDVFAVGKSAITITFYECPFWKRSF